MITKILARIEGQYQSEISLARANGYEAVMISSDGEYDLHYIENAQDKNYIIESAYEFGWDKFVVVSFTAKGSKSKFMNLTLIEAA